MRWRRSEDGVVWSSRQLSTAAFRHSQASTVSSPRDATAGRRYGACEVPPRRPVTLEAFMRMILWLTLGALSEVVLGCPLPPPDCTGGPGGDTCNTGGGG